MAPRPEEVLPSKLMAADNEYETQSSKTRCSELYGPYPRAIPVPFLNKDEETPAPDRIASAKTMFDLSDSPDYRDVGTPDEWLPRDGRLVRLTGRHPFNVEPPLSVLNETRFITPSSLHYVRNHGACPKLKWEEHTIEIGGMVAAPLCISMDELVQMEPRELPVTLVCAGNRRKEQNMIRQTIGFNWGPSGVSTNVWKGVLLRDLLLKAGVPEKGDFDGKHVEFIGVEDLPNKVGPGPFPDEPWGKSVKYGTSVPLARAMNPAYGESL
jgi:nitrate reductase (NAD(P)H)